MHETCDIQVKQIQQSLYLHQNILIIIHHMILFLKHTLLNKT